MEASPKTLIESYMGEKLFIDTWGWLTLGDRQESGHQQTVNFYKDFLVQEGDIYTTDYVLDETFTLFFKRLNSYQANRAIRDAYASEFNYDLQALYENIKQLEKMSNKPHQRLLPKRVVTPV